MIRGEIDRGRGGQALGAIREALDSLRTGTDIEATFTRARRMVFQRALAQSLAASAVASHLVAVALGKRAVDDYTAGARDVATLRVRDVASIIADELSATRGVVVVSGPRSDIEATYRAVGIRDVTYLD